MASETLTPAALTYSLSIIAASALAAKDGTCDTEAASDLDPLTYS